MALHARGLACAAGATVELVDRVAAELSASGDLNRIVREKYSRG